MMQFQVDDVAGLPAVAQQLVAQFSQTHVWCFQGEMGAGKTTLIKEIGKVLGVVDNMSSPTFSIVNEYQTAQSDRIYHFDFYRIKTLREAQEIGVEDYLYGGDLCLLEWPELINDLLPEEYVVISIKFVSDNIREITVELNDRGK